VEKTSRVVAGDLDHAAVGEKGSFHAAMPKPAGKRSQGDFRLSPCPDDAKIGCILWNVDPGKPSRAQE
jgi:hypothetical protein